MSLANITGIFPNATVSNGDLTIPSGDIVSYIPVSTSNPSGAEMVYGLLQTMSEAVSTANYDNVTVTTTGSLISGGTVLRRTYTFTLNLDFDSNIYSGLDVKAEPA